MNDNRDSLEELLERAVNEALEQELEEACDAEVYAESPEQAERMQNLFAPNPRKSWLRTFAVYYSRVAAVLFLAVLIGGCALVASPSLRQNAADFLTGRPAVQEPSPVPVDVSTMIPTEIPEGYALISCSASENWTTYLYQNEDNQVLEVELLSRQQTDGSPTVVGDGIMISQVSGTEAAATGAVRSRVERQTDGYTVVVTGELPVERLQGVCNSISEK